MVSPNHDHKSILVAFKVARQHLPTILSSYASFVLIFSILFVSSSATFYPSNSRFFQTFDKFVKSSH